MKTNNLDVPWVVFDGQIYRADHKPAPFTHDGVDHPDYHDGLVALAYTDEDKRAIAQTPMLIKELEYAEEVFATMANKYPGQLCSIRRTLAAAKGEPQP